MQPAFSTPIAQPHIPAWGELSKNSRLGFTSNNPALYLGHNVCNSTTALGLQSSLLLNRVRSFCSGEQYDQDLTLYYLRARYYNPDTGRFLSRDPEAGKPIYPKTLHKYLYASGDPVNRIDPMGREAMVEYRVTMICGGSLYCGVTGAQIVVGGIIAGLLSELARYVLEGEAPAGHNPDEHQGLPPTGSPYPSGQKPPITPDPGTWPEEPII
jgi:RHS repeat-associated protein